MQFIASTSLSKLHAVYARHVLKTNVNFLILCYKKTEKRNRVFYTNGGVSRPWDKSSQITPISFDLVFAHVISLLFHIWYIFHGSFPYTTPNVMRLHVYVKEIPPCLTEQVACYAVVYLFSRWSSLRPLNESEQPNCSQVEPLLTDASWGHSHKVCTCIAPT